MATTSSSGFAQTPIKETVYCGPPIETVYNGPSPGTAKDAVAAGTVYDPANHRPKAADNSITRKAVTQKIRYASLRFFIVAAISLAEFFIYREGQEMTAYAALLTAVIFGVIGIFAIRLSRGAFLAGLVIYGLN